MIKNCSPTSTEKPCLLEAWQKRPLPSQPRPPPLAESGSRCPTPAPCREMLQDTGQFGTPGHQRGDHRAALDVGQVFTEKSAPFLLERGFADQGLLKYWVYMTRGTPQTGREACQAAGNAGLGRQHIWEMPQEKHPCVALQREGSREAQLFFSIPYKLPVSPPGAGSGLPCRLSREQCCKQDFFSLLFCV